MINQKSNVQNSIYELLVFPFDCLNNRNTQNQVLVTLFSDLQSANADIAAKAQKTFESLSSFGYKVHELSLLSFPLWPVNISEIKQIVVNQWESNNPLIIQRVRIACQYLKCEEGYEIIAFLASKKMHNSNVKVQQEGLSYFSMLLDPFWPNVKNEDLEAAIKIAAEMFVSSVDEIWLRANTFFKKLIKSGKKDDILKIKTILLEACAGKRYSLAFDRCYEIITLHKTSEELISISIEAALNALKSDKSWIRNKAFMIFKELLSSAPEQSIDVIIQGVLDESKKSDACLDLIGILNTLIGYDFPRRKNIIINRKEKNSESLLLTLSNLSSSKSSFMKKQAKILTEYLESSLNNQAEDIY